MAHSRGAGAPHGGKAAVFRPELSLPKLADYLDTTVNHVSQTINAGLQTPFSITSIRSG
ncbi:MAG: hypothetical protein CM15mP84_11140 [Cellvibrionales bacterium]|nr:MAG: hypothetical protein CM15mP84_11140 [Cellvibrionales bacterium]